jgi:hypothetical protein
MEKEGRTMETSRTFGLNKNVGFPMAAIIVAIGAIFVHYIMSYLDQNILSNIINTSGVLTYFIVYDVIEWALIASIFLGLVYQSASVLKSKKIGFALGAIAGIVITALTIYDFYTVLQTNGTSSDMVLQYVVALTIIFGGLYILMAGTIGTGFAYLMKKSGVSGDPSTEHRSYLAIALLFLGLALALPIVLDVLMYYVGYPEPSPYVRWLVEGLLVVIGAYLINKVYRSTPEIAIPVAQANEIFSSPALAQVTVEAPVQAPSNTQPAAPVQVPVHVRSTTPMPAPLPVTESVPAPGHRFCDQCGSENKIGAHFCAKCGNKLE